MKHSARGMYEFLGMIDCPSCRSSLTPMADDARFLRCKGIGEHCFQWKYDQQDWVRA